MFVNAGNGDYNLTEDSPCIDAGDPLSQLDPDGTIADMGAFYYVQYGFGSIEGVVTNSETALPVQDALITIGNEQITTDDIGYYIIEDIFAGNHVIYVDAENYISTSADVIIIADETTTQNFALDVDYTTSTPIIFELEDSPEQQAYPNNTTPYSNSYDDLGWIEVIAEDEYEISGVALNLNWNSLDFPEEGYLFITSPSGTQVEMYSAVQTGIVALELETDEFNGEQAAGSWIIYIFDSYGDGGHQVTDAELTLNVSQFMTVENLAVEYQSSSTANVSWIVPDPFGGSYVIEEMTDNLVNGATKIIEKIDQMGGAISAIESGWIQDEISRSAYEYQKNIDSKKQIIVGVNKFEDSEQVDPELLEINSKKTKDQIESVNILKTSRNNDQVVLQLDRLKAAAASTDNVMPFIIDCVKNDCTLGEISDIFRTVFGEHHPS